SYLGLGDPGRARALVEEGLAVAREQGNVPYGIHASLALARVLLGSAGPAARAQIEAELTRALELAHETGAKAYETLVRVELAGPRSRFRVGCERARDRVTHARSGRRALVRTPARETLASPWRRRSLASARRDARQSSKAAT